MIETPQPTRPATRAYARAPATAGNLWSRLFVAAACHPDFEIAKYPNNQALYRAAGFKEDERNLMTKWL